MRVIMADCSLRMAITRKTMRTHRSPPLDAHTNNLVWQLDCSRHPERMKTAASTSRKAAAYIHWSPIAHIACFSHHQRRRQKQSVKTERVGTRLFWRTTRGSDSPAASSILKVLMNTLGLANVIPVTNTGFKSKFSAAETIDGLAVHPSFRKQ